jgi:hypothetical protein
MLELVFQTRSECHSKPHNEVQGNVQLFHTLLLVNFTPSNSAYAVLIYFLFSDAYWPLKCNYYIHSHVDIGLWKIYCDAWVAKLELWR